MGKKRMHPIHVLKFVVVVLLLTTWALGLMGFFTEDQRFLAWAGYALVTTVAVASTPLLFFAIGFAIEKFRGDRHVR